MQDLLCLLFYLPFPYSSYLYHPFLIQVPILLRLSPLQQAAQKNTKDRFSIKEVPKYNGKSSVAVHGNKPYFTSREKQNTNTFESYHKLDKLGRCGVAYANVSKDTMPIEARGEIGQIRPSGWHTVKYTGVVDGNYLYNRCHLIAYCLTAENANKKNLITGTRYMNNEGMLPFEEKTARYIDKTNNHVLYRVVPVFRVAVTWSLPVS